MPNTHLPFRKSSPKTSVGIGFELFEQFIQICEFLVKMPFEISPHPIKLPDVLTLNKRHLADILKIFAAILKPFTLVSHNIAAFLLDESAAAPRGGQTAPDATGCEKGLALGFAYFPF